LDKRFETKINGKPPLDVHANSRQVRPLKRFVSNWRKYRHAKKNNVKTKEKRKLRVRRILEPRVEVVIIVTVVGAGTAWCDPEIVGQIVATAHATRREFEPVREYTAAVVGRVVGEQSVQPVLLFAPTALAAEHLLVLEPGQNGDNCNYIRTNNADGQTGDFPESSSGITGRNRSHSRASFPVDVLLERIEIEQREHFAPGVVRPEWRDHLFLYRTSVTAGTTCLVVTLACRRNV